MNFFLVQFIGSIGYSLLALSYYKKEKKQILFMQILAYIMFTIHYYFLSGITGAICNFIGLIALVVIYLYDIYKWKYKEIVATTFVIILFGINLATFQNVYSIFPLIASIIVIISFITDNERFIKAVGVISAVCWLIYAIVYKSYVAIVFEVFTLIGVTIAFIKSEREKNKHTENIGLQ